MRKFNYIIQFLQQQVGCENQAQNKVEIDDNYQEVEVLYIAIGSRYQRKQSQRGTIIYVDQVPQMGLGHFIGLQLDETTGTNTEKIRGYQYFQCPWKFELFVSLKQFEIGDFQELDLDEI